MNHSPQAIYGFPSHRWLGEQHHGLGRSPWGARLTSWELAPVERGALGSVCHTYSAPPSAAQEALHRYGPHVLARDAPAAEQLVGREEAGRRGALHEGDRVVATHPVASQDEPVARCRHARALLPGLGPDERAVVAYEHLPLDDRQRGGLRIHAVQLVLELGHDRGRRVRIGRHLRRAGVRVKLDDRPAVGPRPRDRTLLEPLQYGHVVERPVPGGAEERGPLDNVSVLERFEEGA